jgi:AcrR family transcriptional regulator
VRQVKKPAARKAEIVDAALQLFAENGYERTTVEKIIGELGVAKGCFYHHFRSKDDVFAACVVAVAERLVDEDLAIFENRSVSPSARLLAYVDRAYERTATAASSELMADLHSRTFSDLHHRVSHEVAAQLRPALTTLLEEGGAAGEFRVTDPEFTAVAVLSALTGLHEAYAGRRELDLAEHRSQVLILLGNILANEFT